MAIRVSLTSAFLFASHLLALSAWGQNPLNPSGFPLNPARDPRLPPPLPAGEAERVLRILRFENLEATSETLKGDNVEFELRGYRIRADHVEGNLQTQQFQLLGNVNLIGKDFVIRGEHLFVDFEQGLFRLQQGEMDLRPSLLEGKVINDVYLSAKTAEAMPGEAKGHICRLTTCNYDNPHYYLTAKDVRGIADSKLIFKDIRLNVGKTTLFQIPQLVIPISRDSPPITPEVGTARDEGYFLKLRYGIPVGNDVLTLRGDFMSQRGIALGLQYDYRSTKNQGKASLYSDFSRTSGNDYSITASLQHRQDLPFGKLTFQHETRQFNYLTGINNITHRSQGQLSFKPSPHANTSLNFSRTQTLSPSFQSLQSNLALNHQHQWTPNHTSSLQVNWTQSRAEAGGNLISTRQAVDVRLRDRWEFPLYTAELNFQRQIPIGSTLDFFRGIERAPEIILSTDRDKLFTKKSSLPFFLVSFSFGNFIDHFTDKEILRYFFDLKARETRSLTPHLNISYDAGFQQGFYSDDTAQYSSRLNILASYKQSSRTSINFRYHFQQSHGFTPIQIDRVGEQNSAFFDAMGEVAPGLKIGGQVGYDFNRERRNVVPWQTPGIRLEYKPHDKFSFRAAGIYDAIQSSWSSVRMDATWKTETFSLVAAARYDALRSRWANLNLLLDGIRLGRLKVSTLLLYNGFLNRFDARHLSFTYDLHCAEAVLQIIDTRVGFRPGREVLFFIRLKALPQSSPFGLGRQGEPLGPGTGWSG
jgi:hypothetical protein